MKISQQLLIHVFPTLAALFGLEQVCAAAERLHIRLPLMRVRAR